jgi:hypothetical protein
MVMQNFEIIHKFKRSKTFNMNTIEYQTVIHKSKSKLFFYLSVCKSYEICKEHTIYYYVITLPNIKYINQVTNIGMLRIVLFTVTYSIIHCPDVFNNYCVSCLFSELNFLLQHSNEV